MTQRKAQLPLVMILERVGWWLCRTFCLWFPGLGRAFNFPLHECYVGAYADVVLEDSEHQIAFTGPDLDLVRSILQAAMLNDAGDTSAYSSGRSRVRSLLYKIDHCVVLGRSMTVLEKSGAFILGLAEVQSYQTTIKPSILKTRKAPEGSFYPLSCNGDLFQFFANDVLPLLYFLNRYEVEIGVLNVVANANSPPFVWRTLEAISAKYEQVHVISLKNHERLANVTVLWCSRAAEARAWTPVGPEEVGVLRQLLNSYYRLPTETAPSHLLFVSRGDTPLRRLKNEAELITELLDFDFEFFVPKSDDHKSQIEAFRSARIVVAVHGAGLTNLLFCQPGTLVIELFPANKIKSTYCWLAVQLGLRYRAVIGFSGKEDQSFTVKVPLVVAEIEAELGAHASITLPEAPPADTIPHYNEGLPPNSDAHL